LTACADTPPEPATIPKSLLVVTPWPAPPKLVTCTPGVYCLQQKQLAQYFALQVKPAFDANADKLRRIGGVLNAN
jgi:hypothetical protein